MLRDLLDFKSIPHSSKYILNKLRLAIKNKYSIIIKKSEMKHLKRYLCNL